VVVKKEVHVEEVPNKKQHPDQVLVEEIILIIILITIIIITQMITLMLKLMEM
jgi:hypothetical protein